jgi:hypothetical protein
MKEIPVVKLELPGEMAEIIEDNQLSIIERKKLYETLSKTSSNERNVSFNTAMRVAESFKTSELAIAISFVRQCSQILLFDCHILVEPPFNSVAYLFSAESGGPLNLVEFENAKSRLARDEVSKADTISFVRGDSQKEVWNDILLALRYYISGGHPE